MGTRSRRAEELVQSLISAAGGSDVDGRIYELCNEYQQAGEVTGLGQLLSSSDDRVAGEAAWIASELPWARHMVFDDVAKLLNHHSMKCRFWALDCMVLWAGPSQGAELACAAALLTDAEKSVRWKAMDFLARASLEQLQSAIRYLEATNRESRLLEHLVWLTQQAEDNPKQILSGLESLDSLRRKVAVVAAYRFARQAPQVLHNALVSEDAEIVNFARGMLRIAKAVE